MGRPRKEPEAEAPEVDEVETGVEATDEEQPTEQPEAEAPKKAAKKTSKKPDDEGGVQLVNPKGRKVSVPEEHVEELLEKGYELA